MKAPVNAMSLRRIANLMVYLFERRRRQYGQPSEIYVLENPEQAPAKVEAMAKAYEAWAKRCMVEPYPEQCKKKRQ